MTSNSRATLLASIVSLSSFLWGYGFSVLNVCIVPGAFGSILIDLDLSTADQELATALVLVGAVVSAILAGELGERHGYRKTIIVNNILFILGGILCTSAMSRGVLFLGRFLVGLACGIVTNTIPILLCEIAPHEAQGKITSFHQMSLTIGTLASAFFGWILIQDVPNGWRYLNLIIVGPALLQLFLVKLLPESPYWLLKYRGKNAARNMLKHIRGKGVIKSEIEEELDEIVRQHEVVNRQKKAASWRDLRDHKSALILGSMLVSFQAMSGINAVMLYSTKLFHTAGVTDPFAANMMLSTTNVLATILSILIVDRYGRKPLLIHSSVIMATASAGLAATLTLLDANKEVQGIATILFVLMFIIGFAFGLGVVVWIYLTDITPSEVRSQAFTIYMVINYTWNTLVAMYSLSLVQLLGSGLDPEKDGIAKLFSIFSAICIACAMFIGFCLYETKGLSIAPKEECTTTEDEIDNLLVLGS